MFPVRARAKTSGFGGYRIPPGAGTGIFSRQTICRAAVTFFADTILFRYTGSTETHTMSCLIIETSETSSRYTGKSGTAVSGIRYPKCARARKNFRPRWDRKHKINVYMWSPQENKPWYSSKSAGFVTRRVQTTLGRVQTDSECFTRMYRYIEHFL